MALTITTASPISCAPGNTVALQGTGFQALAVTAQLLNEGPPDPQTGTPSANTIAVPLTVSDDSDLTFVVPDGALSGPFQLTGTDGSTAQISLYVSSQYVQAVEYQAAGEGTDLSQFNLPADLDAILRRASAYVDAYIGYADEGGLRVTPLVESHPWRKSTRRIYPYKLPIQSIQQFVVRISPQEIATFEPTDIVINNAGGYVEILSYAVASFALLGSIENLGFTANIVELWATSGFAQLNYPAQVKQATVMVATEMISYARIQQAGLGGFARVKQGETQYDRRQEPFQIPAPAKEMLRPFMRRGIR
jgi:hypothetical protein